MARVLLHAAYIVNKYCDRRSALVFAVCIRPMRPINSFCSPLTMDRLFNVVIFGIAENREISVWKSKIDDVLKFVVGRDVDIVSPRTV